MKKKILFLGLIAASIGGSLQAQDTVWMRPGPLSNYYQGENWIDTTQRYAGAPTFTVGASTVTQRFITPNTLQVYGIAAIMVRDGFDFFFYDHSRTPADLQAYLESHYPDDPTYDNCEESLVLYQYYRGDSMPMQQLGDSLPVHALYTPVSYYIMSHPPILCSLDSFPKPVYERYFSEPQTVHDTFYAGFTQTLGYDKQHHRWKYLRPYFHCLSFTTAAGINFYEVAQASYIGGFGGTSGNWNFYTETHCDFFIFPILTPPDTTHSSGDTTVNPVDTIVSGDLIIRSGNTVVIAPGDIIVIGGDTIVNTGDTLTVTLGDTVVISGHPIVINPGDTLTVNPGDTLFVNSDGSITVNPGGTIVVSSGGGGTPGIGIQTNDLLYRYTSVQPNPATDKVRVTSSFGLTRIEAYDLRGRLLFETPASGLKADLDVSSWPRGTYLLRISTPAGTTTKKLLIR